jgi:UDP-glucuronate 4-epimerase
MKFIGLIEEALGKKAIIEFLPLQPGDVPETFADITETEQDLGFHPRTPIETGIQKFIAWYKDYYNLETA